MKYSIEEENAVSCEGKTTPLGVCLDLTVKNADNVDGTFQVIGYIDRYNMNTDEFVGREEISESQNIKAADKHKFSFVLGIDASDNWLYGYNVNVPTKSIKKQETRYRDVEKTRTVTKYRTEMVPC